MVFKVDKQSAGQRLDIFCVGKMLQYSRASIQKAIKAGHISVNSQAVKPRQTLKVGDNVQVNFDTPAPSPETPAALPALPILYEDKHIKVINKPAGVDAEHIPGRSHRLDKDTTGVLITAKSPDVLQSVQAQFKNRRVKKEYLALVFGRPGGQDGRINQPLTRSKNNPMRRAVARDRETILQAKPAVTEWRMEKAVGEKLTLLRVFPLTGRTHQIRVHLHWLGFPVVGDKLYTFKRQKPPPGVTRQLLHAEKLTLTLPSGKRKTFTAPLPDDFTAAINQ